MRLLALCPPLSLCSPSVCVPPCARFSRPSCARARVAAVACAASQIWSLGIILYELITFSRPFLGENIAQLAMGITRRQPKPLPPSTPQVRPCAEHAARPSLPMSQRRLLVRAC